METEEILRAELKGMSEHELRGMGEHVIELRRVISKAFEALEENRQYDAADILRPYSDLNK